MWTTIHTHIWTGSAFGKRVVRTIKYWRCSKEICADDRRFLARSGVVSGCGEWCSLLIFLDVILHILTHDCSLLIGDVGRLKSGPPIVCLGQADGRIPVFQASNATSDERVLVLSCIRNWRRMVGNRYLWVDLFGATQDLMYTIELNWYVWVLVVSTYWCGFGSIEFRALTTPRCFQLQRRDPPCMSGTFIEDFNETFLLY